ncbi:MAG TPA: amidohydrolase family protein [Hypericibacter adhaerens]|jgi:predicted TIM-barrel fold metal-dependent hydrolase|uniref:amidohydrolase family protein n=1 Tax=Hypericibacter adhaerens TaxID=2602016 RepID=UPI002B8E6966|nr:amidohydrolase family protein [Hypericibacter adhaerens]HWA42425.1 amidohydrolase family protein [Hypericibacter adhaerens]
MTSPTAEPPPVPPPHPSPSRPRLALPAGAWDCHCHVFGPTDRYPYWPDRSYTPPAASLARYLGLLDLLGVEHGVLVQPSVYGTDNRMMVDSLKAEPRRLRGVAVIDPSISDRELEAMHAVGVRGVRINLLFRGGVSFAAAEAIADRIRPLGWHIQFLLDISQTPELRPALKRLRLPVVIDHMGHFPASAGTGLPAFRELLAMLKGGEAWVKLSGPYLFTRRPDLPYADVTPIARALAEAAPGRCVWGTDWPHPANKLAMPDDGPLTDLLGDWVTDETARRRILVENPKQLYD